MQPTQPPKQFNSAEQRSEQGKPLPELSFELRQGELEIRLNGQLLKVRTKWIVFYTLLALYSERHVGVAEICDHYPWVKQSPTSAGKEIWRFVHYEETRLFGQNITLSPPRQSTRQFALHPQVKVSFVPDQLAVAQRLLSLRPSDEAHLALLSECTLLMQSGQIKPVLMRLSELCAQPLNVNDRAHALALVCGCQERLYGTAGSATVQGELLQLLRQPGLNRLNRFRLLNRLARYSTLSADYPRAQAYFTEMMTLVKPDDGLEYCHFHINYSLLLRRTGHLEQAIEHQKLAHDVAHSVQWWYGVQATQSNLALMYISKAEGQPPEVRDTYYHRAKEWALRGIVTTSATAQGGDQTDLPLLLMHIYRVLGEFTEARHWGEQGLQIAGRIPSLAALRRVLLEFHRLENAAGDTEKAEQYWQQVEAVDQQLAAEVAGAEGAES